MAQTSAQSTNESGTFSAIGGVESLIPFAKEAWGVQMKTAQMLFDNTAKLTQTFADFYQTQAAEGLKLTQTCFQTGKQVSEDLRKQFTTLAERAVRPS